MKYRRKKNTKQDSSVFTIKTTLQRTDTD